VPFCMKRVTAVTMVCHAGPHMCTQLAQTGQGTRAVRICTNKSGSIHPSRTWKGNSCDTCARHNSNYPHFIHTFKVVLLDHKYKTLPAQKQTQQLGCVYFLASRASHTVGSCADQPRGLHPLYFYSKVGSNGNTGKKH